MTKGMTADEERKQNENQMKLKVVGIHLNQCFHALLITYFVVEGKEKETGA